MLAKSKTNSRMETSTHQNTYRSSQLPPKRPLVSLTRTNEQFYSIKQISHRKETSNEHFTKRHPARKGENFATTDESSNAHESHFQESLFFAENKKPLEQDRKQKMESTSHTKRQRRRGEPEGRVGYLNAKLKQIRQLVLSHEAELRKMKSEVKERQLFRLLKMHSIQKLKVLHQPSSVSNHKKSK